jgi:hypothetical protein
MVGSLAVHAESVIRHDEATLRALLLPLLTLAVAASPVAAARAAAAVDRICACARPPALGTAALCILHPTALNKHPTALCILHAHSTHGAGFGFFCIAQLASANLDYLVDGLVRHMRDPESFPHSPRLLAALLASADVSQTLLPALAEPAAAAVQGLSILARSAHPARAPPLLRALAPIAAATSAHAAHLRDAACACAHALRARAAAIAATAGAAADAADSAALKVAPAEAAAVQDAAAGAAEAFFSSYHSAARVELSAAELAELDRRRWATYAAAELAAAVADAAAPLLVSEDLQEAMAAHEAVSVRLRFVPSWASALCARRQHPGRTQRAE